MCGYIKAATSLGGAHRCLEDAIAYSQERKQFGKQIGGLQHTQFKLADLAADLHASRLMLRNAAQFVDRKHTDKTMYCAMAKRFVTDNCFNVL